MWVVKFRCFLGVLLIFFRFLIWISFIWKIWSNVVGFYSLMYMRICLFYFLYGGVCIEVCFGVCLFVLLDFFWVYFRIIRFVCLLWMVFVVNFFVVEVFGFVIVWFVWKSIYEKLFLFMIVWFDVFVEYWIEFLFCYGLFLLFRYWFDFLFFFIR